MRRRRRRMSLGGGRGSAGSASATPACRSPRPWRRASQADVAVTPSRQKRNRNAVDRVASNVRVSSSLGPSARATAHEYSSARPGVKAATSSARAASTSSADAAAKARSRRQASDAASTAQQSAAPSTSAMASGAKRCTAARSSAAVGDEFCARRGSHRSSCAISSTRRCSRRSSARSAGRRASRSKSSRSTASCSGSASTTGRAPATSSPPGRAGLHSATSKRPTATPRTSVTPPAAAARATSHRTPRAPGSGRCSVRPSSAGPPPLSKDARAQASVGTSSRTTSSGKAWWPAATGTCSSARALVPSDNSSTTTRIFGFRCLAVGPKCLKMLPSGSKCVAIGQCRHGITARQTIQP
mmetsp:Transcript_12213/g.36282  ORF Transcript_12213/g.36282 Transcript_12213/m.36282 type:complete len:357 (-) Transcript_12213:74-1144(-)